MKRLNLLPRRELTLLPDLSSVEVSDRTQNAFLACAAAIALVSMVGFLQTQRIVQAQTDGARVAKHLHEVEQREANVRTVAQALNSLGFVAHTVEHARGVSHDRLAAVARLGDLLPGGVWLTDVVGEQGQIALKGRARDAAVLGAALRNIEDDRNFRDPRLIGAREHADSGVHYIDFEFALDLAPADERR